MGTQMTPEAIASLTSDEHRPEFEGWAIVELYGHGQIAGQCREVTVIGRIMLRVDVPAVDGRPAITKYYGGGAIYAIAPCTEAVARHAAQSYATREQIFPYGVPADGEYRPPPRQVPSSTARPDEWTEHIVGAEYGNDDNRS